MAKLTGPEISKQRDEGGLVLEPFDPRRLGPNSYDLTLGKWLYIYDEVTLDMKKEPRGHYVEMKDEGFVLEPGELYLGVTNERAGSKEFVPGIEGRSSIGRLGLHVHITAGFGDLGFENHWTLELWSIKPLRIYPGVPVCQVYFEPVLGSRGALYQGKYHVDEPKPVPSRLWQDFA